jgi:hypothetical protein
MKPSQSLKILYTLAFADGLALLALVFFAVPMKHLLVRALQGLIRISCTVSFCSGSACIACRLPFCRCGCVGKYGWC